MATINDIKARLSPPVNRQTLIDFLAMGENLPSQYKVMAYIALNGMNQKDLDNIGDLAVKIITCLELSNQTELKNILQSANIPGPIAEMIMNYGANIIKN